MSKNDLMEMSRMLDERRGRLDRIWKHWRGDAPASFLSKKSRESLDGRLSRLSVNIPRLVVNSKVDRLHISGVTSRAEGTSEQTLWRLWELAGMTSTAEQLHTDWYLFGSAAVLVWPDENRIPRPLALSPLDAVVDTDPATGRPLRAMRRWQSQGRSHALVITEDAITRYSSPSPSFTPSAGSWEVQQRDEHYLGTVPAVPFVRRQSSTDIEGTSAVDDILDLTEALVKVLADALVTSEHYARPRRWATGLEIREDEQGRPVDPFGDSRLLQSEDPATRFGQFDSVRLDGYTDLTATITQQIGSLTGLPPHYLGLHGDQPASADGVRAAEAQLASAAYSDQRVLDAPWSRVLQLMAAVTNDGIDPTGEDYRAVWGSPEIRTPAQQSDAALKLRDMGVPLETVLVEVMGYAPEQARRIAEASRSEQIVTAAARGGVGRLA